jgi:hypothetical protein
MNIEQRYKNEVAKIAANKFLYNGVVPSMEQLELQLKQVQKLYKSIGDRTLSGSVEGLYSPFKKNSLENVQDTINDGKIDVKVLRETVLENYKKLLSIDLNWNGNYKYLEGIAKDLNDKVTFSLFKEADSKGFFNTFIESFKSRSQVSRDSDVNVNTDSQYVSLGFKRVRSPKLDISGAFVSLNGILIRNGNIVNSVPVLISGSSINNLVSSIERGVISYLSSRNREDKYLYTLSIDLGTSKKINLIEFKRLITDYIEANLSLYISADGIDFEKIGEQAFSFNSSFSFEERDVRFIRFNLEKSTYDSFNVETGNYLSYFDCKEIRCYASSQNFDLEKNYFESRDFESRVGFSKAALEVCDYTSSSTSIEYYLNGIPINPINKPTNTLPQVVYFNSNTVSSNYSGSFSKVEEGTEYNKVIPVNNLSRFSFRNAQVYSVNCNVPLDKLLNIRVYKNYVPVANNEEVTPWKVNGSFLEAFIYNNGVWNFTRVNRRNFTTVREGATSEIELRSLDPLYPRNQKLLAEGYGYSPLFVGIKVYPDKRAICERVLVRESNFNKFIDNLDSSFYTEDWSSPSTNPIVNVLVGDSFATSEILSKAFLVEADYISEETNTIRLEARFLSRDENVSPLLFSYSIKVGN